MSRRRAAIIAIVAVAVLALLAFLPAFPPVRAYLVARVTAALEGSGVHVTYSRAEGNPWRGVTLRDAAVEGPGLDVTVDRLRVGYFLPSLIGGELPLDVEVTGARGSLDLSEVLDGSAAGPSGAPTGAIVLQLRRLALADVQVDVQELPFTLPNASVSDLQVSQSGTALDLSGTVATRDGSATLAGRYETLTGTFDGRVERADATIARQWWGGVNGGTVTGTLRVRGPAVTGSFVLEDVSVADVGLVATGVDGTAELDYPVITAAVSGDTLGGAVSATGVVNVAAQRWEAQATGRAGLAEAAGWLLRGSYPDGPPVSLEGAADVALSLSGWDYVALEGTATGAGAVEGVPLEDLSTAFRLPRDGRVRAEGLARLGGGRVDFEVGPGQAGERLLLTASGVDLSALAEGLGAVDARLRLAVDDREDGDLTVEWSGEVAGRSVDARLEARLDPDGWQGFVTGGDSAGGQLEGAVVLADGRLDGGLTLSRLGLAPLPDDARVTLGVSGPASLDGARLTLVLDADGPVTVPGLATGPDLRGSASGVYSDGAVTGVLGRFGPALVSGVLDLAPLALTLDVLVDPTPVALADGAATARVTVPASSLVLGADGLAWSGRVAYSALTAGPASTPDGVLVAEARAPAGEAGGWRLSATSEDGALAIAAGPAGVSLTLDGLPVAVAGADPAEPVLAATLHGGVRGADLDVTVRDAGGAQAELPASLRLVGAADPQASRLYLFGWLGALPVTLEVGWDGPLRATARLGGGPAGAVIGDPSGPPDSDGRGVTVSYAADTTALTVVGGADLAAFWGLVLGEPPPPPADVGPEATAAARERFEGDLGVLASRPVTGPAPVDGTLVLDMTGLVAAGGVDGLAGRAVLDVSSPVSARAVLTGRGDLLEVTLDGEVGGLPVRGAGAARVADLGSGAPLLTLDVGPLQGLSVTTAGVSGAGVVAGVSAGPAAVPDVPWRLELDWTEAPTAILEVAGSPVRLDLRDDAIRVSGPVSLPFTYAGEGLVASLALPSGTVPLLDPAATPVLVTLARPGDEPFAEAAGTVGDLVLSGRLPAELLAAPLPEPARPTGELALAGTADLLAMTATVGLGDDLVASYADGVLAVRADDADLAPYLPDRAPSGLTARVDGTLRRDPASGWAGALRADLALAGDEPAIATLTLGGAGAELTVAVTATGPLESSLHAAGTLTPELRLAGSATALAGAVAAELSATPLAGLSVALTSAALAAEPYLELPPLAATLSVPPDGAPRLIGSWVDATVTEDGALAGRVALPFTLLGQPADLTADLAGTLADPRVTAELTGAGVSAAARASPSAATAELTLAGPAVAAALPPGTDAAVGLLSSPVVARAGWTAADGWELTADAEADAPGAGALGLRLALTGEGAAYRGQVAALLPDAPGDAPVAVATVSGEGADLTAALDMADVDLARIGAAFGLVVDVVATGRASLGTDPMTTELTVDAAGTVEGAAVTLTGSAPNDLRFTLASPEAEVTGRLAWNEDRRLVVTGQAAGRPVEAWLELDDDLASGRLHVDVPGAYLDAVLTTPEPGLRTASVTGSLTGAGPAGLTGGVRGELTARGQEVHLTSLAVDLAGVPGLGEGARLSVTGAGALAPELALSGAVAATSGPLAGVGEAGAWSLAGDPVELSLDWLGLQAAYAFGPGTVSVRAGGDVSPALEALAPDLAGLEVSVAGEGLSWGRRAGFGGALDVTLDGGPLPVEAAPVTLGLRATREGDLVLDVGAAPGQDGAPLVTLAATVPSDAPVTGALAADVSVSGAVSAAGRLSVGAEGAELDLAGDGLSLTAAAERGGWRVAGELVEMPLPGLLPLAEAPRASLRLMGGSSTGSVVVDGLVVESGASRIEGSAALDGRLRVALQAQVDLADLDLGDTRLTGLVRGPLVAVAPSVEALGRATLTAQLDAVGVGVEGVPARVDGAVQVGGTLGDPTVFAALSGRGDLRGALRLEAAPARGRLDLRSTLGYGDVTSDLRVAVAGDDVGASGSLRAGDAILLVADVGDEVVLTGAGRLDGWRGSVSAGLAGIEVEGPLAAVAPAVTGAASLALGDRAAAGTWLSGAFTDLAVAGQGLGAVVVSAAGPGEPLHVTGDGIAATLDPSDLSWRASVSGLTLPGALAVDVAGEGRAAEGRLTGRVTGGAELRADVALDVNLSAGATTVSMAGTLLGGELSVTGRRPAGADWTGQVALTGARTPADDPAVALSARGVLQGSQLVPQVVLGTAAYAEAAGVAAAGRVSVGPGGVTLDQSVAVPLVTAPLRVQGRVAPGLDVRLSSASTAAGQPRGDLRLLEAPAGLLAFGELEVPIGPVTARLEPSGSPGAPRLTLTPQALPEAGLAADLAAADLADLVARVTEEGLVVTGTGAASGSAVLTLRGGPAMVLRDLGATLSGFAVELSGALTPRTANLTGSLELPIDTRDRADRVLPLAVSADAGEWRLTSSGRLGELAATYQSATGSALVDVALALPADASGASPVPGVAAGSVTARLAYVPGEPPAGTMTVAGVRLAPPGWGEVRVDAEASFADGRVGGAATVATEAGSLSVSGAAPLRRLSPALAAVSGEGDTDVEVRLRTIELSELPAVASAAPHVAGALSGVVQLHGDFVFGQLVAPELAVGETPLPLAVQLSGPTSRVDAAVTLGGSLLSATLSDLRLAGSARLERFPLDLLAEAVVGPTDVTAYLTGVARVDVPLADPASGYAALASEELTLERAGVLTRGDLTMTFDDGALTVDRATFSGRGDWRAGGVLSPDRLDFELVADEADFGPMLGLVPSFALLGVGAEGSFTFTATGTVEEPLVSFQTDALAFRVAGTSYRLSEADVRLEGAALSAAATLSALDPVEGDLRLAGDATVTLEPLALRSSDLRFEGELVVPGVGRIDDVTGAITQDPLFRPYLALSGRLGAPLAVQGTLAPLDLRAGGTGLRVAYPGLLIADSTLAADLRLVGADGGVTLSGAIQATEVVLDPAVAGGAQAAEGSAAAEDQAAGGQRGASEAGAGADAGGDEAEVDTVAEGGGAAAAAEGAAEPGEGQAPTVPAPGAQAGEDPRATALDLGAVAPSPVGPARAEAVPTGALANLRFDDLRITAPQRVVMATSFASLEAALDLTLSGTGAEPRLDGEARALRGNLRFAGRDFTVDEAVATFTANRGVLPDLSVRAHTEFEKSRVLTGSTDVSFAAPEGRTFRVDLAFQGPVERDEDGRVRFDVRPTLTSEALIEVAGGEGEQAAAVGAGVRPLTEGELLSLVTLGRLELGSDLIGAGGLGGAVAQGALDTAVDVLLLGELQNALREALGLDVVEIRTSAVSSLLEGAEQFGVSVRLGGYLNPELFASYRIGTADPDDPGFAVTNEVALQYALGPLDLEISGRIDFPQAGLLAAPRSELGLGVAYDVSSLVGVDLSTSLSSDRSAVSFGVTLRW